MNGRNRHVKYRRSVYRRRQIRFGLILSAVIVALLVVLFLIVGNLLRDKTEELPSRDKTSDTAPISQERTPLPAIKARAVLLEASDSTTFASRIDSLTEGGASAASVPLNTAGGSLLYRSPVGEQLGYPVFGTPSVRISSAMEQIDGSAVYLSGVFYLTAFAEEDALLRSVELSRSAAILAEALQQGMDDVLLITPALTADQVDELLRFAEDVRALAPNGVLGLSLPQAILTHENSSALIDRLWSNLDYLALNAAEFGSEDPVAYATQIVTNPNMTYNRLRYQMRVLLPTCADDTTTEAVIAAVEENGVNNWQILS